MNTDKQIDAVPTMSRRDRLRRVVILCRNFARNLAYYRAGQKAEHLPLLDPRHPKVNFWRVMNANCIDMCVLEWCKLVGDYKGKHHWSKIVTDPSTFQARLIIHLSNGEEGVRKEIDVMKEYRDKFLAHLDAEVTMNIPALGIAKKGVWFYHAHVVGHEARPGDLVGLPLELDTGYAQCETEASAVYEQNA
jgi:hypothetical protein